MAASRSTPRRILCQTGGGAASRAEFKYWVSFKLTGENPAERAKCKA